MKTQQDISLEHVVAAARGIPITCCEEVPQQTVSQRFKKLAALVGFWEQIKSKPASLYGSSIM